MSTWAKTLFDFYTNLEPVPLPQNIQWLYPQKNEIIRRLLKEFLSKYYNDNNERVLILGINPGRYGAGITGINFTAPKQLSDECGIKNPFTGSELSAEFIYKMINAYGGTNRFYGDYFIGSVCPLGFVENGKNLNYYDNKDLLKTVEPFIVQSLFRLSSFKINKQRCICFGGEKNFKYLFALNQQYQWFNEIVSLPHPRFIMQYKRKSVQDYIDLYLQVLKRKL